MMWTGSIKVTCGLFTPSSSRWAVRFHLTCSDLTASVKRYIWISFHQNTHDGCEWDEWNTVIWSLRCFPLTSDSNKINTQPLSCFFFFSTISKKLLKTFCRHYKVQLQTSWLLNINQYILVFQRGRCSFKHALKCGILNAVIIVLGAAACNFWFLSVFGRPYGRAGMMGLVTLTPIWFQSSGTGL